MIIAYFPAFVALIGLVAYAIPGSPKREEIGRLAFACGLLVTCMTLAGHTARFLP